MMPPTLCIKVEPLALDARDEDIYAAISPSDLLPIKESAMPPPHAQMAEERHLRSRLKWKSVAGLFGYTKDGYYKDLWIYFDANNTTGPKNMLCDKAFRIYGINGDMTSHEPRFPTIRGDCYIFRLEPAKNLPPPPPFQYTPKLTVEDVYETLVFFRDAKLSAHKIGRKRDAQRLYGTVGNAGSVGGGNMHTDMAQLMAMLNSSGQPSTYLGPAGVRKMDKIVGKDQRTCTVCGRTEAAMGKLMRCPCGAVLYCSKECQKSDWKTHKLVCSARKKTTKKKKKGSGRGEEKEKKR